MPLSPKIAEGKILEVQNGWENLASAKSFGGLTLEQFKRKVKPSLEARTEIARLESQLSAAYNARDDADTASLQTISLVVNGVRGDPEHGEDSALYEAMGYVRKSQRKSGLKRKTKALAQAA